MAATITILYTPDCPNVGLLRDRLAEALTTTGEPAPSVVEEQVADPGTERRGFHGSPALLIDGVDAFAPPAAPTGLACRLYATQAGIEGAPSVDQIVAALTSRKAH